MSLKEFPDPPGSPPRASSTSTGDLDLRLRVINGKPDAVAAALALMERHEPRSLPQALDLIGDPTAITPARFEIVAEAWDRYFHISSMPWD